MKKLYTIRWKRVGDSEPLECRGLTPERLAVRLRAVVRESGPVVIEVVEVERRAVKEGR